MDNLFVSEPKSDHLLYTQKKANGRLFWEICENTLWTIQVNDDLNMWNSSGSNPIVSFLQDSSHSALSACEMGLISSRMPEVWRVWWAESGVRQPGFGQVTSHICASVPSPVKEGYLHDVVRSLGDIVGDNNRSHSLSAHYQALC